MKDQFEKYIETKAKETPDNLERKKEIWENIYNAHQPVKHVYWRNILKYAAFFVTLLGISVIVYFQVNKPNSPINNYRSICQTQQNTHESFLLQKNEYLQKIGNISEVDKQYLSIFFDELEILENEYQTYFIALDESESQMVCLDIEENEQMQLQVLLKLFIELQNKKHYEADNQNRNS